MRMLNNPSNGFCIQFRSSLFFYECFVKINSPDYKYFENILFIFALWIEIWSHLWQSKFVNLGNHLSMFAYQVTFPQTEYSLQTAFKVWHFKTNEQSQLAVTILMKNCFSRNTDFCPKSTDSGEGSSLQDKFWWN